MPGSRRSHPLSVRLRRAHNEVALAEVGIIQWEEAVAEKRHAPRRRKRRSRGEDGGKMQEQEASAAMAASEDGESEASLSERGTSPAPDLCLRADGVSNEHLADTARQTRPTRGWVHPEYGCVLGKLARVLRGEVDEAVRRERLGVAEAADDRDGAILE